MKLKILTGLLSGTAAACMLGSMIASCASVPDESRYTAVMNPNFPVFQTEIDPYIEKQCGTLDCHGQPGRAFRVYGFRGLRLYSEEGGLIPGVQQTTPEEIKANFFALISVEPEEWNRVMARNGTDPTQLLFLRKSLNYERHKGGAVMADDSDPFKCITAWIALPPDPTAQLSAPNKTFCDNALTLP